MTSGGDPPDSETMTPEQAFGVVGNETRLDVLRTLGEADGPLNFSELRERVGYDTAGNFSYHLDKLEGHFVRKTEAGYTLRLPGKRVVEAVLSGTVTETPTKELTRIDRSCPYCGAPVEMRYREERLEGYCTECAGVYGPAETADASPHEAAGLLGYLPLPPAGIEDRTVAEAETAAWTWGVRDMVALSKGVCPRCSARLDQEERLCRDHDTATGICESCRNRHAIQIHSRCTNCIFDHEGAFVLALVTNPDLLAFLTTHGLDPVTDHWEFGWEYEEEVLSTDPFEARFTFTIDGDSLALTVDDQLAVVDVR